MKLTFDTNCLINFFDTQSSSATSVEAVANLLRYATGGQVTIVITTRAEADLNQDRDEVRREQLKRHLAMFDVIGSVVRWNNSVWDGVNVWAGAETGALADEIQKVCFPNLKPDEKRFGNKMRDVDHLVAHALSKRDIFVTDDGHLNKRATELRKFGVVVMRPTECLRYIDHIEDRKVPKTLTPEGGSDYVDSALAGVATFDYSNNNGAFSFGEGHFLFQTKWSKAGKTSIHAYSDAASIDVLALAPDAKDFGEIDDASALDFSSRTRTPRIGQIVIWRNVNGIYAATKLLDIADDTRGDDFDSLTFEFKVNVEGTSFS